ncbi:MULTISPECIES: electron transfer flavoprotein subunit beta/FixA family protein [Carboxydocella]|uniref:Electron transfer flavoprotein subunit beta n=2 Tax=Carboxydocella TaxID=178898 RepID=A0A1T4LTA2_9FIRM|nr:MULTISPECIES: electron transfer flavoprotein subunit beta/FixA family protein [Carboxydocella]AVX20602.1 electron transfer flavoprotein beta subunit [Carboxydocella thermautotrophica]AVX31024.1 electron transfer flavoprotein beta subunit [Carboxydocella thermautotrophica]SJZ57905.1 electron transfer flavoprotein beta subunit [Carboxydocella sporoproducens DSM 16521]GAW27925.1 electron transfer flavoprotein subunit beta [Carboxydocella sp. ULO1]GAW31530.1 electron transfer flavoprotein subun
MKIVVLMKQTFDTETRISLDANGKIDSTGVNYVVNPYCEFAVEEALRIKERLGEGEVIILSAGPDRVESAIRQCLAMGADRGVLINDPALENGDEYTYALALAKALQTMEYDLVLAGFQAVDDGSAQVGPRVAQLLDIPQVTIVTKIEIEDKKAVVTREIDDGVEIIEVPLPALFTAQQGLAEPRYPSMKGIMQAKKKPLQVLTLQDIGVSPDEVGASGARVKVEEFSLPAPRQAGKIIGGDPREAAVELVKLLRTEAKVI